MIYFIGFHGHVDFDFIRENIEWVRFRIGERVLDLPLIETWISEFHFHAHVRRAPALVLPWLVILVVAVVENEFLEFTFKGCEQVELVFDLNFDIVCDFLNGFVQVAHDIRLRVDRVNELIGDLLLEMRLDVSRVFLISFLFENGVNVSDHFTALPQLIQI